MMVITKRDDAIQFLMTFQILRTLFSSVGEILRRFCEIVKSIMLGSPQKGFQFF